MLVIDSHRPIHTANAAVDNGQVMVLMDGKDEAPPDDLGEDLSSGEPHTVRSRRGDLTRKGPWPDANPHRCPRARR